MHAAHNKVVPFEGTKKCRKYIAGKERSGCGGGQVNYNPQPAQWTALQFQCAFAVLHYVARYAQAQTMALHLFISAHATLYDLGVQLRCYPRSIIINGQDKIIVILPDI